MKLSRLTANDNYFEDFTVGEVMKHARSKTISVMENVLITNLVMNTAQGHFNEESMKSSAFGQRITFGGCTASLIIGLASQDTSENALTELGLDKIRFKHPVLHDDTLTAYTEVLELKPVQREDAGEVRFKHWGVNQRGQVVFEGERRTLVKRRSHWGSR